MGADYILHRVCDPKLALGQGDPMQGTTRMLGMLKARDRARAVSSMLEREGQDPATATITVRVMTGAGPQDKDVRVADMLAEAAPLDALAPHCAACDACAVSNTFGCFGYLNYPLTASFEQWLVSRIQPADTLGGHLMLSALKDFGYDGSAMAGWRQRRELLELSRGLEAVVASGFFRKTCVSTDQILQAIFMVGSELDPTHCGMFLMWLGALRVNGQVPGPGTSGDPSALVAVTEATSPEQRRTVAQLDVGAPSDDRCIHGFQQLLFAMYVAWTLGTPMLMDA